MLWVQQYRRCLPALPPEPGGLQLLYAAHSRCEKQLVRCVVAAEFRYSCCPAAHVQALPLQRYPRASDTEGVWLTACLLATFAFRVAKAKSRPQRYVALRAAQGTTCINSCNPSPWVPRHVIEEFFSLERIVHLYTHRFAYRSRCQNQCSRSRKRRKVTSTSVKTKPVGGPQANSSKMKRSRVN